MITAFPTAIAATLDGLRRHVGEHRILAILEPRSNTMRMGVHGSTLAASLTDADQVWVYAPVDLGWDASEVLGSLGHRLHVRGDTQTIVDEIAAIARTGDQVLVMSNGGFEGIHGRLLAALEPA